jgi:hypothetical protein
MGSTIVLFAPPQMQCRTQLGDISVALEDLLFVDEQ